MKLKYEEGFKYTSTIGDKSIKFKRWTSKQERNYLSALENDEVTFTDKIVYDNLILPSIEDKNIVLSAIEQKKLLIDIRLKSISEYLLDTITCKKCKLDTDIEVKIEDIMSYIPEKYDIVELEEFKIKFAPLKTNKSKELLTLKDGVIEYVFIDFLIHIESITLGEELHENIKFKELKSFINDLPTDIFDEIFEKYKDMVDDLILEYDFTCNCGNKETIDYTNIPNLLWA